MSEIYEMQEGIGRVGAYLLDDGNDLTLIDSLSKPDGRGVLAMLKSKNKRPEDIRRIVLTHAHVTHVKGAASLKELSSAEIYGAVQEQEVFEGLAPSGHTTWIPRRPFKVLLQQYVLNIGIALWKRAGIRIPVITFPSVHLDHFLEDGQRVGPVHVIRTPGHSPGSTSFYWPEKEALFSGDAIVTWPRFELGWKGLTEDFEENVRSVKRLVEICRENGWKICRIAAGHGKIRETQDGVSELEKLVSAAR